MKISFAKFGLPFAMAVLVPAIAHADTTTIFSYGFEPEEQLGYYSQTELSSRGRNDAVQTIVTSHSESDSENHVLQFTTGGINGDKDCLAGESSVTIGYFSVEPDVPYWLQLNTGSNCWNGNLMVEVMRMKSGNLTPLTGSGIGPNGELYVIDSFNDEIKTNYILFYSSLNCDSCCIRLSFMSPGQKFLVDEITISKNIAAHAVVVGDLIDLYPAMNVASYCPNDITDIAVEHIGLSAENCDLQCYGARYEGDGHLSLCVEDDLAYFDNPTISFSHSEIDIENGIKYSFVYGKTEDAAYPDIVKLPLQVLNNVAGKISQYLSSTPMEYSTGNSCELREIAVFFKRQLQKEQTSLKVTIEWPTGESEIWDAYVNDGLDGIVITRKEAFTSPLFGNCYLHLENVTFVSNMPYMQKDYLIPISFGDKGAVPDSLFNMVNTATHNSSSSSSSYDLQGHRMDIPLKRGLYIKDGKKILVK